MRTTTGELGERKIKLDGEDRANTYSTDVSSPFLSKTNKFMKVECSKRLCSNKYPPHLLATMKSSAGICVPFLYPLWQQHRHSFLPRLQTIHLRLFSNDSTSIRYCSNKEGDTSKFKTTKWVKTTWKAPSDHGTQPKKAIRDPRKAHKPVITLLSPSWGAFTS